MVRFLLAAHRGDVYSEKQRVEIAGHVEHEHQLDAAGPVITLQDVIAQHREFEPGATTDAEVLDIDDEVIADPEGEAA
jgi:hypothetical protein